MEIIKKKSESQLVDIMEGCDRWEVDVDGQHGMCALVDVMPRLVPAGRTADSAIVQAARTSTGKGLKSVEEDRAISRYLYSHAHTSPYEMVNFKFHQVLPIFVARQLVRHRTASLNEYSLRYAEAKDRFWFPTAEGLRVQSSTNKQVTEGSVSLDEAAIFIDNLAESCRDAMIEYRKSIDAGIGRELARVGLPLNLYTEWYWEIDLNNLLRFLGLRQDKHAQEEIRVYADAMYNLIQPLVPDAIEAYDDYHPNRKGLLLSRMDTVVIHDGSYDDIDRLFPSDRELTEFKGKADRLGSKEVAVRAIRVLEDRAARKKRALEQQA